MHRLTEHRSAAWHMQKQNFCRAWINKDEQTQICFLQGGVGWGVGFFVCVQILVQRLGLGNTMEWVICKKNSGFGVFFVCGQIFVWGLGLGNTMEWVIPMREKRISEKTLYAFKRKSHPGRRSLSGSLQTPLVDSPQIKLRSSCNESLMISLQKWTVVLVNVTVLNSFVSRNSLPSKFFC